MQAITGMNKKRDFCFHVKSIPTFVHILLTFSIHFFYYKFLVKNMNYSLVSFPLKPARLLTWKQFRNIHVLNKVYAHWRNTSNLVGLYRPPLMCFLSSYRLISKQMLKIFKTILHKPQSHYKFGMK